MTELEKAYYKPNPTKTCQFEFTGLGRPCSSRSTRQVVLATSRKPDEEVPSQVLPDNSCDLMLSDPPQPGQKEWIFIMYQLCGKHVMEFQKNHGIKWAILSGGHIEGALFSKE